jgi:hypothetical protein
VAKVLPAGRPRVLYSPVSTKATSGPAAGRALHDSCDEPLWISDSGHDVLFYCNRLVSEALGGMASYPLLVRGGYVYRLPWPKNLIYQTPSSQGIVIAFVSTSLTS